MRICVQSPASVPAVCLLLAAAGAAAPAWGQACDPAMLFGPVSTTVSTTSPIQVQAADINGDGLIDLVCAGAAGTLGVALAVAPGEFGPATDYATGGVARDVRLADLDGDGDTDAVVIDPVDDQVIPMLNDGTGAFVAQAPVATATPGVFFFTLADADNDGDPDILAGSFSDAATDVFLNAGDGSFGPAAANPGVPGQAIVAGDMNGDGVVDAIVTDFPGDGIGVMLGNGDGTLAAPIVAPVVVPGGEAPTGLDVADFDGDGLPDVATGLNSGHVAVLLGTGGGALGPAAGYDTGGPILIDLLAADLDGDGDPDIAVQNISSREITLLINDGSGGFGTSATAPGSNSKFAIADVNADFAPDILLTQITTNTVEVLLNGCGPFGPVIRTHPASVLRSPGDPAAVFSVQAEAATAYQWRLDGVALADDADFSGTQTDTLVVAAGSVIEGLLDVVASDADSPPQTATSTTAVLAVRNGCPADQNLDGTLSPADFTAWIINYNAGCP